MTTDREAVVTAKCVKCGTKRDIRAGEIPEGSHPMCEKCFMPMIAVKATSQP
jgi:NMD protein affecting ribosome stability and mRNA decay